MQNGPTEPHILLIRACVYFSIGSEIKQPKETALHHNTVVPVSLRCCFPLVNVDPVPTVPTGVLSALQPPTKSHPVRPVLPAGTHSRLLLDVDFRNPNE